MREQPTSASPTLGDLLADVDPSDYPIDDEETLELSDGSLLRCRWEADSFWGWEDYSDVYGLIDWARRDNDYDRSRRPTWANGRARIVERDRWSDLWWQPAADLGDDDLPSVAAAISDLFHYGCRLIVVEWLSASHDDYPYAREARSVIRDGCIGGLEPFPDSAYVLDIVGDIVADLVWQDDQDRQRGQLAPTQ
jgi:hypothetical protein